MNDTPYVSADVFGEPVYSTEHFTVNIGTGANKEMLPHYLVINRVTEVVEFESEVMVAACTWADHFSSEMAKFKFEDVDKGENNEEPPEMNDKVAQLALFRGKKPN